MAYPNWFAHYAQRYFAHHLPSLAGGDMHAIISTRWQFLQIGAFTGDASEWLLNSFPSATLTDVDTWEGSDEPEHEQYDWADVERTYDKRIAQYVMARRLDKRKNESRTFLACTNDYGPFDFIYIDGDHTAVGVLEDAVNAIPLLKPGGLIAFDDYSWTHPSGDALKCPYPAIAGIRRLYSDRLEWLPWSPTEAAPPAQAWFRKYV